MELPTAAGNFLAYMSFVLALAQMMAGHFHMGEQPAGEFMKWLAGWKLLVRTALLKLYAIGVGMGDPTIKTTVLSDKAWWLHCLGLKCTCSKLKKTSEVDRVAYFRGC
mmetsp:Transcript_184179/g.583983  ORF Transcript_184179/g.583983 Transcript_184179/m.583983 type:complete len:108 (-) Transcript_184179:8-331(-)